jgi:probable HAF family extracellular repeat protein
MKPLLASVFNPLPNQVLTFLLLLLCVSAAYSQADGPAAQIKTIFPTFTTIDVPGAGVTSVQSINTAGDMAGVYAPMNRGPAHAFLLENGVFTYFDYPGAYSTLANGINDSGLIVGFAYFNGGSTAQGFKYNGTKFNLFNDGANSATFGMGINNAGLIVGGTGSIYETTGFELRGGAYKSIAPPGNNVYIYATAVNNRGEVVGWTDSGGFSYRGGSYLTIAVPGAFETEAQGVNDNRTIVGWYFSLGGCTCAFALQNGAYVSFGYPGAVGTFAYGVNGAGQVVGSYTFDNTTYHGFVTSPVTAADFQ